MKHCFFIVAIVTVTSAYGQTVNFDARPGLWETTTITDRAGYDLSKFPPEMRAKMEEAMKKRGQQTAKPHVSRSCMTKEKLQKDMFLDSKDVSCKHTLVTNSRSVIETKVECSNEKMAPTTGVFHLEALSRESVKGTLKLTGTMNMDMTLNSKWISDSCGDVK